MSTQEIIKEAKARFNLNYQKIQLSDKYDGKLIFTDQGGLWKATAQLISLLNSFDNNDLVVLDTYNNPINVNRLSLLEKAKSVYNITMQEYHKEYESLKNKR